MRIILLIVILFINLLLTGCANTSNENNPHTDSTTITKQSPEELKMQLKQIELSSPLDYIKTKNVTIHDSMVLVVKPSLFSHSKFAKDGYVVNGIINNTATLAEFKDIVITVTYYSKTETEIGNKDYTIYEFIKPTSESKFSIHVYPPEGWTNFHAEIKTATGVQ